MIKIRKKSSNPLRVKKKALLLHPVSERVMNESSEQNKYWDWLLRNIAVCVKTVSIKSQEMRKADLIIYGSGDCEKYIQICLGLRSK